ncbi:glycoside hydrolase family 9 protein [Nibricoccus sp. IMCC34717]|uniref:glycoside hydrolase family 9 protein n=1 Tax=Nibricoccus sp. IMCC34717 TaxID=3034021 RepID=UPI00384F7DA2
MKFPSSALAGFWFAASAFAADATPSLKLNDAGYLEMPGLNVMLASDYYPDGHQGGLGIIQNGQRVATNGDLRLNRTPGQWSPMPAAGKREVDPKSNEIRVHMAYPDPTKNRTGFNPIDYPDLNLGYTLSVRPEGNAIRVRVDLDTPIPDSYRGEVSFNFELFPGLLFGKTWQLDNATGLFQRQANGPGHLDAEGNYVIDAFARGKRLVVAPESDAQRLTIEALTGGDLELIDGRAPETNGWFVVRSVVPRGATQGALEWRITAHTLPNFVSAPVIQLSQVGYHPAEPKTVLVELDPRDRNRGDIDIVRILPDGRRESVLKPKTEAWGRFLRFDYLRADFSALNTPGLYEVRYGQQSSQAFRISSDLYSRHVWQPTLDTFLPVQMCHMRINDRFKVWHGACHLDDARMAPINLNHFDGYVQGPSTLCAYQPGEYVPGLDRGGWHDAGDHDLRIESQAETVYGLALAREEFGVAYDNTSVDQDSRQVELMRPDGKPDILQQVEHGLLSFISGYKSMGRLYRGIQEVSLRQYVLLGDPIHATDNKRDSSEPRYEKATQGKDDRWVFTEDNPNQEISSAAAIAAAARVMRGYNDSLAADCQRIAIELWDHTKGDKPIFRVGAAVELLLTTGDRRYADFLLQNRQLIADDFERVGWVVGRAVPKIGDAAFTSAMHTAAASLRKRVEELSRETPYGVPYRPDIWGAGWDIQNFGMRQYFLHRSFPKEISSEPMFRALQFVLGVHPGSNTASFISGVGSKSTTTAYGFNRDDWTYVPGGSASGTAIIRPDFPELLEWPYLWQQTEYCLGGSTTDYLILALAAEKLLSEGSH